jgi:mono/diheme cytochrome c family protein
MKCRISQVLGGRVAWIAVGGVVAGCTLTALRAGAQGAATAPDSVVATASAISAGRAVFHGQGTCAVCHGQHLEGGIGPLLTAHEWKDAKAGSLAAIVAVITGGVEGTAMVAHPGGISDEQARDAAAYIWAVSHNRAKP